MPLKRFVEKPAPAVAEEMLAAGHYLWNTGLFLFSIRSILAAPDTHAPEMVVAVKAALDGAETDLGFLRLAPEPWAAAENVSIDYAVMEKSSDLAVVPFSAGWSDLGGWDAVWSEMQRIAQGVACHGPATAIGCENTLLRSEDDISGRGGTGAEGHAGRCHARCGAGGG